MKKYLKLLRVTHWAKNGLILLPLLFSGKLFDLELLCISIIGVIEFSLLSSAIYINNDIQDIDLDKKHPRKKHRPLPSGEISIKQANTIKYLLILVVIILTALLSYKNKNVFIGLIPLAYLIINIAYSKGLKNIAIIDVVILVSGFLLRVLFGSVITGIEISNWLYLMVMSASFYLGFGKRRNEIIKNGNKSREVLKSYTKEFLDKNMYSCLTLSIVSYSMWATDASVISRTGNNYLIWTIPLIMIIFMLYSLEIEKDSFGDPVDVIINNKSILIMILIYGLAMFLILYLI